MTTRINILLADDHVALRQSLALMIDTQPDMQVVAQAANGGEAVELAARFTPDVAVLDVSMPMVDGIEAAQRIRNQTPSVRVLGLTRHTDPTYLRRLLRAGASGYVLKRSAADELFDAIRAVARGETHVDPSLASAVPADVPGAGVRPGRVRGDLTEREEQVLRLIAWGRSNKEVASQLQISIKTVEGYKAVALDKLGLRSRTDILRHALARGWIDDDASPL
ncbi:MAG: response regulator transcription factor [Burkholderiaceae bacterium]